MPYKQLLQFIAEHEAKRAAALSSLFDALHRYQEARIDRIGDPAEESSAWLALWSDVQAVLHFDDECNKPT